MSTTDSMRRKARAALERRALPIPPEATVEVSPPVPAEASAPTRAATPATAWGPEIRARLMRIEAAQARQEKATRTAWAAIEALRLRLDLAPTAVVRCEAAATAMENALEATVQGVTTVQETAWRVRDAATEMLEHREGRLRRMAAALLLAAALPGVLGNIWLAWRAHLL
ncbi:hypothetical protein FHR71_005598 [Methylobacterium sp. RAS18]|nr:hypothetical protein [Methylobacterium sp. RAS18]